ncbi:G-protein coupled receptor GRL101-like [Mercenaria mercenaria]|uniref:G-protein coupled receptor GRL101-like n=1 Tax=Mercenaria mercenaria TaxID=6596 RepID=UPI00234E84E2|nr:G-protein coupled receptor GRL101-like [Mercenaria mercenaria]
MCGCTIANNEIVILVYQQFYNSHTTIVDNFAKQFYNLNTTVRIIRYETKRPLVAFSLNKIQLHINDEQLQPFSVVNRIEKCEYRMMAEHLINSLRFSETAIKGIIFLDTDPETVNVAKEIFRSVSHVKHDLTIYRIREMPNIDIKVTNDFPHVTDVVIRRWKTLTAIGADYFSQLCTASSVMHIPKSYKCSSSQTFILSSQVCDGAPQCIYGDDERLCNFSCPTACKCRGFSVNCSNTNFDTNRIESVPKATRLLDMSFNKALNNIIERSHINLISLVRLNLSHCDIDNISPFAFHNVRHLLTLDLSFNVIKVLRKSTFEVLTHLTELNMMGNLELTIIESNAFRGLKRIQNLDLAGGKFRRVSANTFSGLTLEYLDLSDGSIEQIEPLAFKDISVTTIRFDNNNIKSFHQDMFNGVLNLKKLRTPAYKFCCVRPSYMKEEDCYPTKDEFSSCEDLMRLSALQTMLWFIGLTAFFGNLLSIMYRLIYDRERLRIGFGIFVTNLAAADFLMSVYLIIIAVADAAFRNRYIFVDDYWRSSAWCKLAGVLSTVSSEASILFICLITIDRLIVVKYPLGQLRVDKMKACVLAAFAWVLSIAVAIIPVVYVSYFQDKFYSKSGVCIALPLTRDRPPGWMYSVAIFVGLNFATFLLVAFGQWLIFSEIKAAKNKSAVMMKRRQKDLKIARNLLLVVATDFLCWFPIGVMGMMALRGHVISGDVYAWSAVFLLPINSALNPVLYTVTAILGRKKFAPSSDEQTRNAVIGELGLHRLNTFKIGRYFHDLQRQSGEFLSISTILDRNIPLTTKSILTICIRLAKCLDDLHNGSMFIGNLNIDKVLVYVRNNQIIGDVRLRGRPALQNKQEDSLDDMFQMGNLVRSLYKCRRLAQNVDHNPSYSTRL